jgi:hypothetical protein
MRGRASSTSAIILLLAMVAVLVHGYHLGIEDQDVYLSAINKHLNPALYPHNSDFFTLQMQATVFDKLVAVVTRVTHVRLEWLLFFAQVGSIYLILLGCWNIARRCFASAASRWASVLLVAGLLTIPVAGTALYIVDQYLHPRALATAAILFAVIAVLDDRRIPAILWLVIAALMHPMMAAFGISYCVFLGWRKPTQIASYAPAVLPLLRPPSPAWQRAAAGHRYYFVAQWEWHEWLGIVAPLALVAWFAYLARRQGRATLAHMCERLFYFGLFQFAVALALTVPPQWARGAALQPMRWMQLFYLLFFVIAGGLIGEYVLREKPLRWMLLFIPLFGGMFYVQRQLFPASPHIEIAIGMGQKNDWERAFAWIRDNTPQDAYFALNPKYLDLPGEDNHGFRALAQRSMMAEDAKDPGSVKVFPELEDRWLEQITALEGWKHFGASDLQRLQDNFGVQWVLLERDVSGLPCPYQNHSVRVCRIVAPGKQR